jgi:predicted RNA binding protein YcfA (HicA-like mRNA interferase family)
MPRIVPLPWKVLECIFQKDGFVLHRQESSHRAYVKKGVLRPLIIPTYKDVGTDIIFNLIRTSGITRQKFFEFWDQCK